MAETTTTFPAGVLTPFVVPDNVYVIRATLQGGSAAASSSITGQALGGTATGLLQVTPGETLQVAVGLAGGLNSTAATANGDTLGRGGSGAKAGGASSHIRRGSTRLIVAGGAGATGSDNTVSSGQATAGGNGGGAVGGNALGFGFPGSGGGADPGYVTSDGEASADSSGAGGGGVIGGRAGRYGTGSGAYGAGGGGSGKVPTGGTMTTGTNTGNGSVAITVGVKPFPGTISSPAVSGVVDFTQPLDVVTVFNGASAKDTQSAIEVRTGDGQVYSGGSSSTLRLAAGSLALGDRTLSVRHANQHGTWSDWSAPTPVSVGVPVAAPTGLVPASGATLTSTPQTFTWTPPAGSVGYRVRRMSDDGGALGATIYYDSGSVTSTASSLLLDFPVDARAEWVQVASIGGNGLTSAWLSGRYLVQRTRPAVPTAVATAVKVAAGYQVPSLQTDAIDVAITNPAENGRAAVDHNDVWAGAPGALVKVNPVPVPPNSTFRWQLPPGLVDHLVLVRAVAASGAVASGFATGSPDDGYGQASYGQFAYGMSAT